MTFAALIREERKRQGLTQKDLARLIHISPQYLCDMELGRRAPILPATWLLFSHVLGVEFSAIRNAVWEFHEAKIHEARRDRPT